MYGCVSKVFEPKGFLVRAPDSSSDYESAAAAAAAGAVSSFREHAEMDKGTCECDGSKEPQ